jgi:thiamine pyrophosphokinase
MENNIDAVILANGEYPTADTPLKILREAKYVVCCDGGADRYIELGHTPDVIIGDGDSLSEENRVRYADIIHYNPDQETNDQTKAVEYLTSLGYTDIAIVAATGKREDHTLGNIALLTEYMQRGVEVEMYTDYGVFIPCRGTRTFTSHAKQAVSIFNVSAIGLHSSGLEYPIYDFTALWQGTLNRSAGEQFTIEAEGDYIVFMTY